MNFKPKRSTLLIILGSMGVLLILYGVLRSTLGLQLPPPLDTGLPDFIMICALGLFLWNRQIAKKEAAEKKLEEEKMRRLEEENAEPESVANMDIARQEAEIDATATKSEKS